MQVLAEGFFWTAMFNLAYCPTIRRTFETIANFPSWSYYLGIGNPRPEGEESFFGTAKILQLVVATVFQVFQPVFGIRQVMDTPNVDDVV